MSAGGGPNITTNGLILYLDAANNRSYNGTGSTWYDLSGNVNSTLYNNPTFSTINNGIFQFNGSNTHIDTANLSSVATASFSVNVWVKFNSITTAKVFHVQDPTPTLPEINIDIYGGLYIHFYTANAAGNSTNNIMYSPDTTLTNVWYNICVVMDNSIYNKYLYVNGILKNSQTTTYKIAWPNYQTRFGLRWNNAEPLNGNISNIKIYNRALSAQEVLQNYNAHKFRFGIN